jgi:tetratricopeptide (TPR) repeat protein
MRSVRRHMIIQRIVIIAVFFAVIQASLLAQGKLKDSMRLVILNDKDDSVKTKHLLMHGYLFEMGGDLDSAQYFYLLAKNLSEKAGFKKGTASSLQNLGNVEVAKGNIDAAKKRFNESLKIKETINDHEGVANTYGSLANLLENEGKYPEALQLYRKALAIQEKYRLEKRMGANYGNMGIIYYYQGDFPTALDYYFRSLKIAEKYNQKDARSINLGNIGSVYLDLGDLVKAEEYILKAIKLDEEMDVPVELWYTYLGNIYSKQGKFKKALECYNRSLDINSSLGNKQIIGNIYNNIGNLNSKTGNFSEAELAFKKAISMAEEVRDLNELSSIHSNLGSMYTNKGDYKPAFEQIYKALSISSSIGAMDVAKANYGHLSDLYERSSVSLPDTINGKLLSAVEMRRRAKYYYKRKIAIQDSLFNDERNKKMLSQEMNYEFEKKELKSKADHEKRMILAEEDRKKQQLVLLLVAAIALAVSISSALIFRTLRVTKKQKMLIEEQNKLVEKQKEIVEEKQKEILDSIYYARRIQQSFASNQVVRRKKSETLFINQSLSAAQCFFISLYGPKSRLGVIHNWFWIRGSSKFGHPFFNVFKLGIEFLLLLYRINNAKIGSGIETASCCKLPVAVVSAEVVVQ